MAQQPFDIGTHWYQKELIQMTVPAELKSGSVPMTDASTSTEEDLGMPLSTLYSRK